MGTVSIGERKLYYESHGTGEPLLMIAGLASDSLSWLPIAERLAATRQLILLDNRGTGRTTPMDGPISVSGMVDDVLALLDHLDLTRVDVLGHSMGGFVAQELAGRFPQRVSRLILAATGVRSSEENVQLFTRWADLFQRGDDLPGWVRELLSWLFTPAFMADEDTVEAAVAAAMAHPYPQSPTAFRRQVEALAAFDGRVFCRDIQAATLILCGQEDRLFPPDDCRALTAIEGSVMQVLPGAAHSIHAEAPAAFTTAVETFLA